MTALGWRHFIGWAAGWAKVALYFVLLGALVALWVLPADASPRSEPMPCPRAVTQLGARCVAGLGVAFVGRPFASSSRDAKGLKVYLGGPMVRKGAVGVRFMVRF